MLFRSIKGARRFGFDNITELLVQKVHETILEVNLSNVVKNLNFYRSFMKPETKLVCMIKADAYGAGAIEDSVLILLIETATSEQMLRASSSSPCTNTAYSRRDARSPVV